jgi:cysteinyl-tRNA synthetase
VLGHVDGKAARALRRRAQCDDPAKNVFDIHGGGIDLVFPHHENEIAQSCCAFGGADGAARMANYWMHNGFLQVEGEKMSKSLGNFVTINELLETEVFGGRKWPGEVLRLAMLKTHYRQPIDWTVKALEEAEKTLFEWAQEVASRGGTTLRSGGDRRFA